MEEKQRQRAIGTNGSGGPAAGTAGILELIDDVMVCIFQHVEDDKTLLVVIPSVGEPGKPPPCLPHRQTGQDDANVGPWGLNPSYHHPAPAPRHRHA